VRDTIRHADRHGTELAQAQVDGGGEFARTDPRAVSAEETIVKIVFEDPSLAHIAAELANPDDFSSQLMRKFFAFALEHPDNPSLAYACESITVQELSVLSKILSRPSESSARLQALKDCSAVVSSSAMFRNSTLDDDALLRYREISQNRHA
jgi:hypothetical protein